LSAVASAGTIKWYTTITGGSSVDTGTTYTTPIHTTTTNYYVDATLSGCTTTNRTEVAAFIQPAIDSSVNLSGNTLTVKEPVASYQWLGCNNSNAPILGATFQSYVATNIGDYKVEISKNRCISTSDCKNIKCYCTSWY